MIAHRHRVELGEARKSAMCPWEATVEAAVGRLQARLQDLADARVAAGAEVGLQIAGVPPWDARGRRGRWVG